MSYSQNFPTVSVVLGEAVTALHSLLKLNSSGVAVLTTGVASEDGHTIGTALETGSIGDTIAVRHFSNPTKKCVANGAFSKGARVYTFANGEVDDVATSLQVAGVAMEAATAAGDVVEVMTIAGGEDALT